MGSEILARKREEKQAEKNARREEVDYILETYGMDECEDGDILYWTKQFVEDGPQYNYVATRARGQWYISGKAEHLSWVDLLLEIERENAGLIQIYKVCEVEEYFVEQD